MSLLFPCAPQMNDGGAVSPNLNGQVDRGGGNGGPSASASTADRDLLFYQQLTSLGYSEVSDLWLGIIIRD